MYSPLQEWKHVTARVRHKQDSRQQNKAVKVPWQLLTDHHKEVCAPTIFLPEPGKWGQCLSWIMTDTIQQQVVGFSYHRSLHHNWHYPQIAEKGMGHGAEGLLRWRLVQREQAAQWRGRGGNCHCCSQSVASQKMSIIKISSLSLPLCTQTIRFHKTYNTAPVSRAEKGAQGKREGSIAES